MADAFSIQRIGPSSVAPVSVGGTEGGTPKVEGRDFRSFLTESLEKANELQTEADRAIQRLVTGQTQNVAEVFTTVRKAEVAFSLLMEIRNKLMDAYQEIRQMQV